MTINEKKYTFKGMRLGLQWEKIIYNPVAFSSDAN